MHIPRLIYIGSTYQFDCIIRLMVPSSSSPSFQEISDRYTCSMLIHHDANNGRCKATDHEWHEWPTCRSDGPPVQVGQVQPPVYTHEQEPSCEPSQGHNPSRRHLAQFSESYRPNLGHDVQPQAVPIGISGTVRLYFRLWEPEFFTGFTVSTFLQSEWWELFRRLSGLTIMHIMWGSFAPNMFCIFC